MEDFSHEPFHLDNGLIGRIVQFSSGSPVNFHQALAEPDTVAETPLFGQFFSRDSFESIVIVVPGSLGVAASHLAHAARLTEAGHGVFVIDPFGSRQVTSTVANQAQYSFAASAWDVLAAAAFIRKETGCARIGAQGHSRGGTAVLHAASVHLVSAMAVTPLIAVYAAYPWCGFQFLDPAVGSTRVHAIIGDQDEWCLPQQVQGYIHAMSLAGCHASMRIIEGAHHSFDRGTPMETVADASVAPGAPTTYLTSGGIYVHPVDGPCDPATHERDLMLYGVKSGYGVRGARIGSSGNQVDVFRKDMIEFWNSAFS